MRSSLCWLSMGLSMVAAMATGSLAQDEAREFQAPPNTISLEETGSVEIYRPGFLQIRDSKKEAWILKILPETRLTVAGEAQLDYLRPGLSIQVEGELDKDFLLTKPIETIELVNSTGRPALGLFRPDVKGPDARPERNPGPGTYRIRGKLTSLKDDVLVMSIGSKRIAGELAKDAKVTFTSDDAAMAEAEDAVKAKFWYADSWKPIAAMNIPGKAYAEEITITLSKPLAPTGRKGRVAERATGRAADRATKTTAPEKPDKEER
jgi:hypothetical protein